MKKLILYVTFCMVGIGNAQNVFHDNFNAYNVNAQLSGQGSWTNNSSNGGTGSCTGALCTNAQVQTPGFNYLNYGSSNNSVQLLADTDGCGTLFTPITSGDMYVGLMLNLSSSSTNPNDFFRVNNNNGFVTTFRVFIKTVTANSFSIGISKGGSGNAIAYTNSTYGFNQDHLIILKYTQSSGVADDVLNLYVDPIMANGVPGTPDATTNSGTDQAGNVDRLVFRQNATATPTGRAGLVSVALSWTGLISSLTTTEFQKETFVINTNEVKSGNLSIQANKNISNANLKIFDIDGKTIESKIISLTENINNVAINPIQNAGIYIIEISSDDSKYNQKFIIK